jgi:ABC-type dipeptide/oligopeptide/nickel transport system permease subunit
MTQNTIVQSENLKPSRNQKDTLGYRLRHWVVLLARDRGAMLGVALFILIVIAAVFSPWVAQHDPLEQDLSASKQLPSWMIGKGWDHLFGTDVLGRDLYSRIIFGTRVSLTVGLFGVLIAGGLGLVIGMVAGYLGGRVDGVIVSLVNILLALPYLLFVVFIASVLGRSLVNVILIFGITNVPLFVRITRGEVMRIRKSLYVEAAVSVGARTPRILFQHILPNLVGPLITVATFQMSAMIFYEAGLGFLGLSVPPTVPSWGNMLAEGRQYLTSYPWVATFPGLAIMVAALSMNLIGDWLRNVLDPRMREVKN